MFTDEKKHGEVVIDEIGQLMLRAADYMEKHGHTKFEIRDRDTGAVCWAGALLRVSSNAVDYGAIATRMGFPSSCAATMAVEWNNHSDTTGEMVVARLRQFA
jgi:hypothetical protein